MECGKVFFRCFGKDDGVASGGFWCRLIFFPLDQPHTVGSVAVAYNDDGTSFVSDDEFLLRECRCAPMVTQLTDGQESHRRHLGEQVLEAGFLQ